MKTAKEKAKELVDKCMRYHRNGIYNVVNKDIAKQYAIIAVDEILNLNDIDGEYSYYLEVKQEIKKL